MRKLAMLTVVLLLCAPAVPVAAEVQAPQPPPLETYAVVVNASNPSKETGDAAKKTVKALFLKDLTRWADGVEAKPYDRGAKAPEHTAFLQDVLGMSPAELARHWLRMKNMSGVTPPMDVDTDRILLRHVERHDGAFGVVKLSAAKVPGVRVLFEFKAAR